MIFNPQVRLAVWMVEGHDRVPRNVTAMCPSVVLASSQDDRVLEVHL